MEFISFIRILKLIAASCAGFYMIMTAAVYEYQERLIFSPDSAVAAPPKGMGAEAVRFKTADGETLSGWWMPPAKGSKTALFFHGNGGSVAGLGYQMEAFRKLGLGALVFDYRGYGASSGEIDEESDLFKDGEAAFGFLKARGVPVSDIIVWGQSLGGGVASEVARGRMVAAVVMDSTFYSMEEMAGIRYPFLPTGLLLKYPLRTDMKLGEINAPLLVIHSPDDEIVPLSQGEKLYAAARGPKKFVRVTGSHICAYFDCEAVYIGGVREFLGITPALPSPLRGEGLGRG